MPMRGTTLLLLMGLMPLSGCAAHDAPAPLDEHHPARADAAEAPLPAVADVLEDEQAVSPEPRPSPPPPMPPHEHEPHEHAPDTSSDMERHETPHH